MFALPALLGACSKTTAPVQLDFIGTAALTSGSKTVSANDTLTTRAYAVGNNQPLKRLRITVKYAPGLSPIDYPVPLSSYDPKNGPVAEELVYLDSLIAPLATSDNNGHSLSEYLFVNQFTARSTSGTEQWQYTATDAVGESASRAYRLTVCKPDSAAVYHSYITLLRPVPQNDTTRKARFARPAGRVFLSLRTGLLLPKYAVLNQEASVQGNQERIDLIALSPNGTSVSLSAPADTRVLALNAARWPNTATSRRATELRATTLSGTDFGSANTKAFFDAAFNGGTAFANPYNTGALAKSQVVAFRVTEGTAVYTGLLLVSDLILGSAPKLTCAVKVLKKP